MINFLDNGGPSKVVTNLALGMKKLDNEVVIITLIKGNDKEVVKKLNMEGISIISIDMPKKLSEVIKKRKDILRIVNKENPDIVHTHGIVSTIIAARFPYKKITTIHNNIFEDYGSTYGKKGKVYAWIHINSLKKYDQVVCCSKDSLKAIKKYVPRCTYIYNGIDFIGCSKEKSNEREVIRAELKIPSAAVVYEYVGVINSRKRVVELIGYFNTHMLDDEYLIIVGDGELMPNAIAAAKNERVLFTGYKKDVSKYMKAADVYVSNSESEGFSIACIEALYHGLYLFLSQIPSHQELLDISRKHVIGYSFCGEDFCEKKECLRSQICSQRERRDIYKKYLTGEKMSAAYYEIMKKVVDE